MPCSQPRGSSWTLVPIEEQRHAQAVQMWCRWEDACSPYFPRLLYAMVELPVLSLSNSGHSMIEFCGSAQDPLLIAHELAAQ